MAGSDEVVCKRNAACRCPDCVASSASFSLSELKAITSNINYEDTATQSSIGNPTANQLAQEHEQQQPQKKPPPPQPPSAAQRPPPPQQQQQQSPPPQQQQQQQQQAVMPSPRPKAQPSQPPLAASLGKENEQMGATQGDTSAAPEGSGSQGTVAVEALANVRLEDIDQETLPARVADKNWKVRKEAVEQLAALFAAAESPDDPVFATFEPQLTPLLDEMNVSVLDAALDAVLLFVDRGPWSAALTEAVVPVVISKALPGRPSTVKKANAVLLKSMEVDTPEVTVTLLLEVGLADKKPKVPPACMAVVLEGFRAYGGKHMPYKTIRSKIKGLFDSANKAVREGALELIKEVVRWVGMDPFKSIVGELRSAQQTEINEATKDIVPGQAVPTIGLRKDRGALAAASASGSSSGTSGGGGQQDQLQQSQGGGGGGLSLDPYDLVEPVDLVEKLAKTDFSAKVKEAKWSDKVEGLQIAIGLIGDIPKILPHGDMGELVRELKGLVGHSHFQVAITSIRLLGLVSSGLREHFRPYAPSTWGLLVQKAKDKKAVPAITEALGLLSGRSLMSIEPLMDGGAGELEVALDPKKMTVAHVRQLVLEWLDRCLAAPPGAKTTEVPPGMRPVLAKLLVKCLEDSDAKVREAGTKASIGLVEVCRRGNGKDFRAVMSVYDEIKASNKKVYERLSSGASPHHSAASSMDMSSATSDFALDVSNASNRSNSAPRNRADTTTGGGSGGGGGGPPPRAALSSTARPGGPPRAMGSTLKRAGSKAVGPGGPSKAASSSGVNSRMAQTAPANAFAASGGGKGGGGDDDLEEDGGLVSIEEATEVLAGLGIAGWDEQVVALVKSDKWQERKDALAAVRQHMQATYPPGTASPPGVFPALVVFLSEHSKKFKDANVNIVREALEAALAGATAVEHAQGSDRSAAAMLCSVALDKVTDRKLRDASLGMLTALAEMVGPGTVTRRVMKAIAAAKAPPLHIEGLGWLKTCVADFGANRIPLQALVTLCVGTEVESGNANIRKGAITLLGGLYEQVGPPLKSLALPESLKAQVKTAIQAEFDRVGFDPSKAKGTRKVKGEEAGGGGAGGGGGAIPRLDLGTLKLLGDMGSTDGKNAWQVRKKAMEDLLAACDKSGHFIEANKSCAEYLKALKARLSDSQSNLKPIAASAMAEVLISLDPPSIPKFFRLVGEPLLAAASDNKKVMRDAALASVESIMTLGKGAGQPANPLVLEAMLPALASALMNTVGRTELLTCVAPHMATVPGEATLLVGPLLDALQDKTASARAAAETCLVPLLRAGAIKPTALSNGMRDFAPAVKRSLNVPIARITEAAAAQGPLSTVEAAQPAEQPPPPPQQQVRAASPATSETAATTQAPQAPQPSSSSLPRPPTVAEPAFPPPPPPSNSDQPTASLNTSGGRHSSGLGGGNIPVKTEDKITHVLRESSSSIGASMTATDSSVTGGGCDSSPSSSQVQQLLKRHDGKKKREEDFRRTRWVTPPEEPRSDDVEHLKSLWTPYLVAGEGGSLERLFPAISGGRGGVPMDTSVYMKGIDLLGAAVEEAFPVYVDHLDLVFKWFTLRLSEKENVQVLQKLLRVMVRTLESLRDNGYSLKDFEAAILVPYVLEKSGQSKDRFRKEFRVMMSLLCDIYPFSKYAPMVVATLGSKNTRTRATCLDEIRRLIDVAGPSVLGKKGLKEVAKYVDARETDVRSSALDVIVAAYERVGRDQLKLNKLLDGGSLSDKVRSMVEDKLNRQQPPPGTSSSSNPSATGGAVGGGVGNATTTMRATGRLTGTPAKGSGGRDGSATSSSAGAMTTAGASRNDDDTYDDEDETDRMLSTRRSSLELFIQNGPPVPGGFLNTLGQAPPSQQQQQPQPRSMLAATSTSATTAPAPSAGPFQFHDDDITYGSPPTSPRLAPSPSRGGDGSGGLLSDTSRMGDSSHSLGAGEERVLPVYNSVMTAMDAFLAQQVQQPQAANTTADNTVEYTKVKEALMTIIGPSPLRAPGAPQPPCLEEEALRLHGDALVAKAVEVLDRALGNHHGTPTAESGNSRVDAVLGMTCLSALRHLYRLPPVCLCVSPETLAHTLVSTWTGVSVIQRSSDHFPPGEFASKVHDGLKKLATEATKGLPLHVTLAALLNVLTDQRLHRSEEPPHAQQAVKTFLRVVQGETLAKQPFDRVDVSKIIIPLDAFFSTRGPAPGREAEEAVKTLIAALVERLGVHKLQAYMTLAGLDHHSSSSRGALYRHMMSAAHQGGELAVAMVGKLPEVVELVQKVLDIHSDPELMKRLHSVLKSHPEITHWAEHLKLYHLSDQAQQHILMNLARLEAAPLLSENDNAAMMTAQSPRRADNNGGNHGGGPAHRRLLTSPRGNSLFNSTASGLNSSSAGSLRPSTPTRLGATASAGPGSSSSHTSSSSSTSSATGGGGPGALLPSKVHQHLSDKIKHLRETIHQTQAISFKSTQNATNLAATLGAMNSTAATTTMNHNNHHMMMMTASATGQLLGSTVGNLAATVNSGATSVNTAAAPPSTSSVTAATTTTTTAGSATAIRPAPRNESEQLASIRERLQASNRPITSTPSPLDAPHHDSAPAPPPPPPAPISTTAATSSVPSSVPRTEAPPRAASPPAPPQPPPPEKKQQPHHHHGVPPVVTTTTASSGSGGSSHSSPNNSKHHQQAAHHHAPPHHADMTDTLKQRFLMLKKQGSSSSSSTGSSHHATAATKAASPPHKTTSGGHH